LSKYDPKGEYKKKYEALAAGGTAAPWEVGRRGRSCTATTKLTLLYLNIQSVPRSEHTQYRI
jgi:hypothetical protein